MLQEGIGNLVLVSSDWHLPRGQALIEATLSFMTGKPIDELPFKVVGYPVAGGCPVEDEGDTENSRNNNLTIEARLKVEIKNTPNINKFYLKKHPHPKGTEIPEIP